MENNENEINAIVNVLQEARTKELYAINQYNSHAVHLFQMGLFKLSEEIQDISIEEMHHARELASHLKRMGIEPTDTFSGEITKQEEPKEIFKFNAEIERKALNDYNKYRSICLENEDAISADLFLKLIKDEQKHFDYFDTVAHLIEHLKEPYLASMANAKIISLQGNE